MHFRFVVRVFVLLCGMSAATFPESIPPLYGAAAEMEDTSFAAAGVNVFDSLYAMEQRQHWNSTLRVSKIPLANTKLTLRTGSVPRPFPRVAPTMQEALCTFRMGGATIQAGAGYFHERIRDAWIHEATVYSTKNAIEHASFEIRNGDCLKVLLNGVFFRESLRRLLIGSSVEVTLTEGTGIYRSMNYSDNSEFIDYTEFRRGDGSVSADAGIGYWRDFTFRGKPYKLVWLLEGSYRRSSRSFRSRPEIAPWLLSFRESLYGYRYDIRSSGFGRSGGGGELQCILSERFMPLLPPGTAGKGRLPLAVSLEKLSLRMGFNVIDEHATEIIQSNAYSDGWSEVTSRHTTETRPWTGADHTVRLYLRSPLTRSKMSMHLFGTLQYDSYATGKVREDRKWATYEIQADFLLGICAFVNRRLLAEFSWEVARARETISYVSMDEKSDFLNRFLISPATDFRWWTTVRLLY
jgi:hypothetical protein